MSCYQCLYTDQVAGLSDEYNRKRHFIRARPQGRLYENLVCIVLLIGSELNIMKKYLIARERTYIELIFRKDISVRLKTCTKTGSSKNAKKRPKSGLRGSHYFNPQ